jgi:hypothetical protein
MERGNGSVLASARRAFVAFAIVATVAGARAGEGTGDSAPPVVVTSAPAGCRKLGEVNGSHQDMATPSVERAQKSALEDARKLGATHVMTVASGLQYKKAYYRGIAYRCPAPHASPQAK